jgi:predicted nucleic acid-binding Zn ribbon protein
MKNCPKCGAVMTPKQRVCPQRCGYMFFYPGESMPLAAVVDVLRFAWRRQRTEIIVILCLNLLLAGACLL